MFTTKAANKRIQNLEFENYVKIKYYFCLNLSKWNLNTTDQKITKQ